MSEAECCEVCGASVGATELRRVPRRRDDGVVEAQVCVPCVAAVLDEVRTLLADDDGADFSDAVMAGLVLAVWFRSRGVADAALAKDRAPRELLAAVRDLLDELQAGGGKLGRRALCSACLGVTAERAITVVPAWNDELCDYVTTFRCPGCLADTIAQTRARLADPARPDEVARVCEFFKRHTIFVHEYLRGDPLDSVRPLALHLLDLVGRRALIIPIGETVTLSR